MKKHLRFSVFIVAWLPALAAALSSDPDQPINVEADEAMVDENRGVTEYEGSVLMTQGSIRIRAAKVTIHSGDDGFEKAVLLGQPARFRQRPDNSTEYVRASASRIEYLSTKNLLILLDDARVTQGDDLFSGNRITYDTRLNRVRAEKAKSGKGRVKITINPKKKPAQ